MIASDVILTGIKPSGSPHLGNYIGAIKPALNLAEVSPEANAMYFLADYHALTLVKEPVLFRDLCHELAATWIACGLDPDRKVFYRQSDVPEVFELSWILSCATSKGLMNRAHAYKAHLDQSVRQGQHDPDAGVNMGAYSYPILMAADILLFQAKYVPVGRDQEQHIEIARDIAARFNRNYGEVFRLPLYISDPASAEIPGTDGRKMSKAYNNSIPLFASRDQLRKDIFRIKTDSSAPGEPRDAESSLVFRIFRQFADRDRTAAMREGLQQGRITWKEAKEALYDVVDGILDQPRARYEELMSDRSRIDRILEEGATKARDLARPTMDIVRRAVGRL